MKIVLFDLGRTLEHHDLLLPGAIDVLDAVTDMRDADGASPGLGLVSDFFPADMPQGVTQRQQEYYAILEVLGLRSRFEPLAQRVTLSTEVGVDKPDPRIFRAALDKFQPGLEFNQTIFTTERLDHVQACRALGMHAIHFKGLGQTSGEIEQLSEATSLIRSFMTDS